MPKTGHVAIDFDGTLAVYDGFRDKGTFGVPVRGMSDFVRRLVKAGWHWSVFTARDRDEWGLIKRWLVYHAFPEPMTIGNTKRMEFTWILDDRAVEFNGDAEGLIGITLRRAWWKDGRVKWRRSPYADRLA